MVSGPGGVFEAHSFSSVSATALLPVQDKLARSGAISRASCFLVSCGLTLSEVGLSGIRKPQVGGSIPLAGSILFNHSHWKPLLFHLTFFSLVPFTGSCIMPEKWQASSPRAQ